MFATLLNFSVNKLKKINPKKWRLKDKYVPNISHDLGSHLIAITSYLLAEYPANVMCKYFQSSNFKSLIDNGYLNKDEDILRNTFLQLKYFNNNYRPIYHLERMFYNIVSKIHNL